MPCQICGVGRAAAGCGPVQVGRDAAAAAPPAGGAVAVGRWGGRYR